MAHHFPIDPSRFSLVSNNYDYKVSLIRGMLHTFDPTEDYLHPNRKPVHEIKVDGAPILQIFHYPENATASYVKSLKNFVKPLIIQKGVMQKVYEIETNKLISESIGNVQLDCAKPNKYFDKKITILNSGYWNVQSAGDYCFKVYSDDDSQIMLNGQKILKVGSMNEVKRNVRLEKGSYLFESRFENTAGQACFTLEVSDSGCNNAIFRPFEEGQEIFPVIDSSPYPLPL